MSDASKIVIDNDGSSSLMYLPLDKLLEKSRDGKQSMSQDVVPYKPATEDSTRNQRDPRARGIR